MSEGESESARTVLIAGAANLLIAVAKLVAGLVSGSSAMLAEAAHSVGDTINQAFLLTALRRSQRPADPKHPFGYGKARYFWALLAAVCIFVLGAGFAAYEGIGALLHPRETGSPVISFAVLGVAFLVEGVSFVRAIWQLRSDAVAADASVVDHLRSEAEPALRAVVFEDGAALLGLLLAAAGIALDELTGTQVWDACVSLAIAALLVAVAFGLGRQNAGFLVGKAVPAQMQRGIVDLIGDVDGVDGVIELLTMRLGPDEVLVAARVALTDDYSPDELEAAADEVERRVREQFPEVRHLFLDPTPGDPVSSSCILDPGEPLV
ncbi:cation transporter [Nocardioides agariphilus]|uniref:Cation transporter n=1 Tax=Nocardioides agariphilus TaxID=433664 RepID=A0A930VU23_9ACTN|nr:cation transporter [Nocardioides agariphilus]